jgi:hypothetical protein
MADRIPDDAMLPLSLRAVRLSEGNGITTIMPTVRRLSLRTWLLGRYLRADPPPTLAKL